MKNPHHFAGVDGVRILATDAGWQVQVHPEFDNSAPAGWVDAGPAHPTLEKAVEEAPFQVPPTHEF